jgi:hypothetical protein
MLAAKAQPLSPPHFTSIVKCFRMRTLPQLGFFTYVAASCHCFNRAAILFGI